MHCSWYVRELSQAATLFEQGPAWPALRPPESFSVQPCILLAPSPHYLVGNQSVLPGGLKAPTLGDTL